MVAHSNLIIFVAETEHSIDLEIASSVQSTSRSVNTWFSKRSS